MTRTNGTRRSTTALCLGIAGLMSSACSFNEGLTTQAAQGPQTGCGTFSAEQLKAGSTLLRVDAPTTTAPTTTAPMDLAPSTEAPSTGAPAAPRAPAGAPAAPGAPDAPAPRTQSPPPSDKAVKLAECASEYAKNNPEKEKPAPKNACEVVTNLPPETCAPGAPAGTITPGRSAVSVKEDLKSRPELPEATWRALGMVADETAVYPRKLVIDWNAPSDNCRGAAKFGKMTSGCSSSGSAPRAPAPAREAPAVAAPARDAPAKPLTK